MSFTHDTCKCSASFLHGFLSFKKRIEERFSSRKLFLVQKREKKNIHERRKKNGNVERVSREKEEDIDKTGANMSI